jgi:hypothetical protein
MQIRMHQPSLFSYPESDPPSSDHFQCTDVGLAGALETLDFAITHMHRIAPGKIEFWFVSNPNLHAAVKAYWDGSLTVSARSYSETMRSLKTRIHNLH